MAVNVTEAAKQRIRHLRTLPETAGDWLRIGVRGGGCSGFTYVLNWAATPEEKDKTFEFEDVRVCVDRKSYLFVNGIELDFEETVLKTGFVFRNPNAETTCSCGSSFGV